MAEEPTNNPKTEAEPHAELASAANVETKAAADAEVEVESKAGDEIEVEAETKAGDEAAATVETVAGVEMTAEAETVSNSIAGVEVESEAVVDTKAESKSDSDMEIGKIAGVEVEAEVDVEAEVKTETQAEVEAEAETKTEVIIENETRPEAEVKTTAEDEVQAEAGTVSDGDAELSFWDHLDELRIRITKMVIALAISTFLSFALADKILWLLTVPIGGPTTLQSIEITENISMFMKISLLSGFIISLPLLTYQLIAFIVPGLLPNERKWLYLSIPAITILFLSGVLFTYYVMLPNAIPFLLEFMGIKTVPRLANYMDFVTALLFWVGVSFEFPLVIFILAKIRLVSARVLAKQWRIALVVIAILAAVITPTGDPINMGLLMAPLTVLYILGIILAWIARRREA